MFIVCKKNRKLPLFPSIVFKYTTKQSEHDLLSGNAFFNEKNYSQLFFNINLVTLQAKLTFSRKKSVTKSNQRFFNSGTFEKKSRNLTHR
jgi:hypothetical protein